MEKELTKQLEDERRNADQYKAENEEEGDLWVIDEDKEEEVGEDAEVWTVLSPEKLDEVREQELAKQLEEMEDELQPTKDQKRRLEVILQTRRTQFERDLAAREEVRKKKRRGMAKQLRDLETEL